PGPAPAAHKLRHWLNHPARGWRRLINPYFFPEAPAVFYGGCFCFYVLRSRGGRLADSEGNLESEGELCTDLAEDVGWAVKPNVRSADHPPSLRWSTQATPRFRSVEHQPPSH